jgi:broad specificity phosphatase PhoE
MVHKRLIFIRHAHRDTEIHSRDNGLSDKGKKQVRQVVRFSQNRELEDGLFLSSPKVRCVETITPVAEALKSEIQIDARLGEGGTSADLVSFVDWWKYEAPDLTIACSHGDVIPMLVEKITGGMISIKKAGWCEIELVGREAYLTWLVQKYE